MSREEKNAWAIFTIPITFLAKYEGESSLELDWLLTFIVSAGIMRLVSILLQKSGFGILDEIKANVPEEIS